MNRIDPKHSVRGPAPAFTLVELLVTVGIIALLAALLLPVLGKAKAQGRGTACLSNLRQVGVALQLYVEENQNRMPEIYDALIGTNAPATNHATIDQVLSNHLAALEILRCPADDRQLFEQTGSSYSWNVLVNGQHADHLRLLGRDWTRTPSRWCSTRKASIAPAGRARSSTIFTPTVGFKTCSCSKAP